MVERTVEHVLAEYNGPQLVTLLDQRKNRYLGIASDADARAVRWVHAPISKLEFDALITGTQNLRDALLKETVWVVDASHGGKFAQVWEVPSDDIPASALPDHGALVPLAARKHLCEIAEKKKKKPAWARFVSLGGKPVVDNLIPFNVLASFMSVFQRLCTALADAIAQTTEAAGKKLEWDPGYGSMLRAGLTAPSSYAISVHPADSRALVATLEEYKNILDASDDNERVSLALKRLSRRAAAAYAEYLEAIDDTELEVFTRWDTGSAFVGSYEAKRIRSISSLQFSRSAQKEPEIRATGYFSGFKYATKSGAFNFVELGTNDKFSGLISPVLKMTFGRAASVTLGPKVIYRIRMIPGWTITKLGKKRKRFELLEFTPIDPPQESPPESPPEPTKK